MTVSQGNVIAVNGNRATVKLSDGGGCGNCPSRDKCKDTSHMQMEVPVPPHMALSVNDRVLLAFSDSPVAALALVVYLLPIVCLIAGAIIGDRLDDMYGTASPVYTLALAVICFAAPLLAFRLFRRRIKGCNMHHPQLLEVYQGAGPLDSDGY